MVQTLSDALGGDTPTPLQIVIQTLVVSNTNAVVAAFDGVKEAAASEQQYISAQSSCQGAGAAKL